MSELPPEAAELIARARGAHDPTDPEAPQRVRERVAAVVATGGAQGPTTGARGRGVPHELLSNLTVKFWGTALLIGAVVGGLVLTAIGSWPGERRAPPKQPSHEVDRASSTRAPLFYAERLASDAAVADSTSPPAPERSASRAATSKAKARPQPPPVGAPSADSLAAEMRLLRASSDALDASDPALALRLLDQYRAAFEQPRLAQEHDGLRIVARCALHDASARDDAQRLLAKAPKSVLRESLVLACKLKDAAREEQL